MTTKMPILLISSLYVIAWLLLMSYSNINYQIIFVKTLWLIFMTIRVAESMATDVYFVYAIEHMFSIIYTYQNRSEQDISTEIKHEIFCSTFEVTQFMLIYKEV